MNKIWFSKEDVEFSTIKEPVYVQCNPYVGADGIYIPVQSYVSEDTMPAYRLLISKDMFVEVYNKWIKGEDDNDQD